MGIFGQKLTVFVTALAAAVVLCGAAGAEEPAKPAQVRAAAAGSSKKAAASDGNKVLPSVPRDLADKPTLIVFDLVPERGIDRGLSNLLTELVIDRVSRMRRYSVIGQKDLDKMLSWEQNKQLKGCSDTSCLVQIAGALGASYYVEGSIGNIGDQYLVTLKLMDANKVAIVERATEKTKKDENVIVGAVEKMVDAIMGITEPGPRPERARQDNDQHQATANTQTAVKTVDPAPYGFDYSLWGKVGVFSGVGFVALGGVFTYMASKAADDYKGAADAKGLKDANGNFDTYNRAALGSYIAGGAIAVTGAVLWVLSATEQRSTAASARPWAGQARPPLDLEVTIQPVAGPGYGAVMATGRW